MLLKFNPDLSSQEIFATDTEQTRIMGRKEVGEYILVHTFDNPILVTDNYRIALLDPTTRDTLFTIMGSRPRIVEYDGTNVYWDDSHVSVWSPSIDTLLIAKVLKNVLIENPQIKSAIEIGCGSGFLSKFILDNSSQLETITINDINPNAIKCAQDNIKDTRATYILGDGLKEMEGKTYDLIVCNPPYIPRPDSVENNPYEGVSLLNYLIHEGHKHLNPGGMIVIGMSSLSDDLVLKEVSALSFKIEAEMEVPLKINNILNNADWLNYLKQKGVKTNMHDGYEYWHIIKTIVAKNI